MSKSLKTVQTVCKVCMVLAEIVFVLLVVGAVLMLACGIFIGAGKMDALLSSGALALNEMLQQYGATQEYVTAVLVCLTIIIAAEAVVAKFINVYFKHELKAGTPFTFEGAKEMLRLGIITIAVPAGARLPHMVCKVRRRVWQADFRRHNLSHARLERVLRRPAFLRYHHLSCLGLPAVCEEEKIPFEMNGIFHM